MLLLLMNGYHFLIILQLMALDTRGSRIILQSHCLQKQDGMFPRLFPIMVVIFRCQREQLVRILRIITVVDLMGYFLALGIRLLGTVLLVHLLCGTSIYKMVNMVEVATCNKEMVTEMLDCL